MKLKDLFQIKSHFHRSVQIELDPYIDDYILTQAGLKILWRIANALHSNFSTKAWTITGPYGSGKSAVIIFLKTLFSNVRNDATIRARELLKKTDIELYNKLFTGKLLSRSKGYAPAFVSAARERVEFAIVKGLLNALNNFCGESNNSKIFKELEKNYKDCENGKIPSVELIIGLCIEVANFVVKKGGCGIILVIDELGKCLEAAALSSENDIFILQKLAEVTSRSEKSNILLFTVLHQAFERYAVRLNSEKRGEWAKIQGRFEDVSFVDSIEQVYKLIANSIEVINSKEVSIKTLAKSTKDIFSLFREIVKDDIRSKAFFDTLHSCLPLHPLTTMALVPLFRSKFAQNERSLFAFLTSMEPGSFFDFLSRTDIQDLRKPLPLYNLCNLYDYLIANFGITLFTHSYEKKWIEIDQALTRATSELERKIIKTVGMLNLLSENIGLAVSKDSIICAIEPNNKSEISQGIDSLCNKSIVVFRRHSSSYILWGGSDIDIEKKIAECLQSRITDTNIVEMLNKLFSPRPRIAKRHLYKKGTLRYFVVRYIDIIDLKEELSKEIIDADGQIFFAIPASSLTNMKNIQEIFEAAPKEIRYRTLIGYAPGAEKIVSSFKELLALHWIKKNTPELQGDQIAMREIEARLLQIERLVDENIDDLFFSRSTSDTIWIDRFSKKGEKIENKKILSERISTICDKFYHSAPLIKNELINRKRLSSNISTARRELFHHILEAAEKADLGIKGFPPELSIYRSLISESGLHQETSPGRFEFVKDSDRIDKSWRPLWSALNQKLLDNEEKKIPITEMIDLMRKEPFGIREGVAYLLLAVLFKAQYSEIALFEQGTFKPVVTPIDFDLITRSPHKFSIQLCRISGIKAEVFDQIVFTLVDKNSLVNSNKKVNLLHIVKMLCTFINSLPDYAKTTVSISDKAKAVRKCLFESVEPATLLFKELPSACGFYPITTKTTFDEVNAKEFVSTLKNILLELRRKESELYGKIENILLQTFALEEDIKNLRGLIKDKASQILTVTLDPVLKAFLVRAADDHEHSAWLDSIGTIIVNRPPLQWSDNDLLSFEQEMATLKVKIERYERLALEKGIKSNRIAHEVLNISIISDKQAERSKIVHINQKHKVAMESMQQLIAEVFRNTDLSVDLDLIIGSLSKYMVELIDNQNKLAKKE